MEMKGPLLCLLLSFVYNASTKEKNTQSVFPDRTKPPGLKHPRKTWWAKEITPDLHISGRLTERQIKYAADSGFKSIVSLFTYPDDEPQQTFGGDYLPNTAETKKIVEDVADMKFVNLLDPMDEWASIEAVEKLTKVMPNLPHPVLLYCDRGYTISFVTLMYLANQSRVDPAFTPRISSADFYNITAAMGLDFIQRIPQEVVVQVTGEPNPKDPPRPNTEPEEWMDYWLAHPVYRNWYSGGQITPSHLPVLDEVGFRAVVNLRSGIVLDGRPNQEEVNLLNIKAKTGTYASKGHEPRQSKARLEETRIDPKRPNTFISPDSPVNYESRNYDEFGDEVGYQPLTEELVFKKSPLKYYHMPLDSDGPYTEFLEREMPRLLEIGRLGPVLLHCASGQRTAYVSVLAAALQYDKDLAWALRRVKELGYEVSKKGTPELHKVFINWLVTKRKARDEL